MVMKEAVEYLSSRPEPLTSTLIAQGGDGARSGGPTASGRKVSLGTVPDFSYTGKGVRLIGVSPGSPGEKAGLREGDVIVRVGISPVEDLRAYADLLKTLQPGDKTSITFVRQEEEQTVQIEAVSR